MADPEGLRPGTQIRGNENAGQEILSEIAALLTFALASVGSFLAFEWPPLLRKIILTLLLAVIVFRVVRAIGKLLFALSGASGIADQPPSVLKAMRPVVSGFRGSALLPGFFYSAGPSSVSCPL